MATALALVTILVWSSLAALGSRLVHLSPFLTVGVALTIGGLAGLVRVRDWRVPLSTLAIGIGGLFGYHALLFAAFRLSPQVEVNLLNYLWPLLIVVLSPVFLPRFRLRPRHLLGALLGLSGAALIVTGGRFGLNLVFLPGYLLAAAAALVWASYSLLTKRVRAFPTGAVGAFCLASGLLSLGLFGLERALSPPGSLGPGLFDLLPGDWALLVFLGLGPMGGAFYTWDAALKRGDPRTIGSLSYLTPLLSTLNLVLLAGKPFSTTSALAMALIIAGALIGSLDLRQFRRLSTKSGAGEGDTIGNRVYTSPRE